MQLRYHTPRMWPPEMLALLMPVADVRKGSRHPLAWQGGDYLTELRATWRADPRRFDLPGDTLVLGCPETLPTFAAVFRALGREVDDGDGLG